MSTADTARLSRSIEMDDLVAMSIVDLIDLYRTGEVPGSVVALDSARVGRLLSVRGLGAGEVREAFARVVAWPGFPWLGKRFQHIDRNRGRGTNRFRVIGEREWFDFQVSVARSVLDGYPCLVLDYAMVENPRIVRRLRDELREVSPGLFVGPICLRCLGRPRLVGFFACESTSI